MSPRVRWLVAVSVMTLIAAPSEAAWKEARSRNFLVYSEGSEAALREVTAKLEKYNFMLHAVSGSAAKPSQVPLKVFLMSTRKSVQDSMGIGGGEGVAGYYQATSRGPIAVGTRPENDRGTAGYTRAGTGLPVNLTSENVLLHEFAHHFMLQYFPAAYPAWYVEGFAEYYGTTRFKPNDVIEVGHVASDRYMSFEYNDWLPVGRMLAAKTYADVGQDLHLMYSEGWLLVHYLGNAPHRRGQLAQYLQLLNEGVDAKEATDRAFGPGAKALDAELRDYAAKRKVNAVRLPFKPIDVGQIAVRTVSPAEEALFDQEVALGRGLYTRETKSFAGTVRRIAARFPGDPYALGMLAEAERLADNDSAAEAATAAWLRAAPASGRAKLMQAQLTVDRLAAAKSADAKAWDAARAQIAEASKLAPADPMIFEAYYDSYTSQGVHPPPAAQNALFRAFQLVPQDDDIRFKLAADYEARDMIREAIAVISPIAAQSHDPDEESKGEKARRQRLERKYKVADDAVDSDSPVRMLKRLEAKLAAANPKPAGAEDE